MYHHKKINYSGTRAFLQTPEDFLGFVCIASYVSNSMLIVLLLTRKRLLNDILGVSTLATLRTKKSHFSQLPLKFAVPP